MHEHEKFRGGATCCMRGIGRRADGAHVRLQVMFAYATGPLAWSIVAFRNSLVFHSLDKAREIPSMPVSPHLTNGHNWS